MGVERRPLKSLERVLSKAGMGSRTDARSWIGAGRVRVNGRVIENPDHWVDLERDKVSLDGKVVRRGQEIHLLLYKPSGYVTTRKDPDGRPTVYDLIRDAGGWVVPVGRLDLETSGLLILTNDTQFAEHLTNPKHEVAKTYQVKAADLLNDEQLERLRQGVELSDGPTGPAVVERLRDTGRRTHLQITITEGRNRQVRRMLEAIDSKVLKLVRTAIGPIRIGDLPIGKWRPLTEQEVQVLRQSVPVSRKSGPKEFGGPGKEAPVSAQPPTSRSGSPSYGARDRAHKAAPRSRPAARREHPPSAGSRPPKRPNR